MYVIYYGSIAIASTEHEKFPITSAILVQKKNTADVFTFTMPPSNPYSTLPQIRKDLVTIKMDGNIVFVGDVISERLTFDNSREFTCQGCLAWLHDALRYNFSVVGQEVWAYFTNMLTRYRELIGNSKRQLHAGNCTVNGTITVDHRRNNFSFFNLMGELITTNGGIVLPRYVDDKIVLDFLADNGVSGQTVRFGENLLDLEHYISAENIATVVYAFGKDGLTISTVNQGKAYIANEKLVAQYGWVALSASYDTDDVETLFRAAQDCALIFL